MYVKKNLKIRDNYEEEFFKNMTSTDDKVVYVIGQP